MPIHLEQLFPGFQDELVAAGAHLIDLAGELAWLSPAGWGVRFPSDVTIISCSRTLLEWRIRQRILTIPQIGFLQGSEVKCLLSNENNTGVVGVSVASRHRSGLKTAYSHQLSSAELVVDATGRGSKAPQWLYMMGYPTPLETTINPHLGYASRIYQLPADFQSDWRAMYLQPAPPTTVRGGGLYPLEKNRWIVTLWGGDGDYPPTTEFGFLEFARSLPSPLLYRAHLRSFGFYEKMLGSVYSKCHGLFKQSDRFRMGNHRASVVGGVASEEEDSSPGLELSRPDGRHLLSPQEWMQLGGLAQRFAPLLNGLLALQTVAGRRDA